MIPGMKVHKIVSALFLIVFTGALAAACSDAELGEKCEDVGKTDECEDGLICGADTGGAVVCLKLCAEDTQCPADRECNGVSGTNVKACRLKTTK